MKIEYVTSLIDESFRKDSYYFNIDMIIAATDFVNSLSDKTELDFLCYAIEAFTSPHCFCDIPGFDALSDIAKLCKKGNKVVFHIEQFKYEDGDRLDIYIQKGQKLHLVRYFDERDDCTYVVTDI